MVQWLDSAPNASGPGWIPSPRFRVHLLLTKDPACHNYTSSAKTWHRQINEINILKEYETHHH